MAPTNSCSAMHMQQLDSNAAVSCMSPEEPLERILDYLVSLGRHLGQWLC